MKAARSIAAEEREAAVDSGGFQVLFHIPERVSIAADEGAKSFRLASTTIAPELIVRATPALDSTGFLEASFKHDEDAPLLPGRIAIYRDGIFVGRGQMALIAKEQPVRLGFGADDRVKIERTVLNRSEGATGLITTVEDRPARVQDRGAQRPRCAHSHGDRGPASGERDRRRQGRDAAGIDRSDRARRVRASRRGRLEFRSRRRRGARHPVRLAGALAVGQIGDLRAGPLESPYDSSGIVMAVL